LQLVSVVDRGARKAGYLEQGRVFVTDVPGLDVVISQRINLKSTRGAWRPLEDVTLDVPLRPGAILGTGSNYRDHLVERVEASAGVNEGGEALEFFVKTGSTLANLDAPLHLRPAIGKKIDQETELGIVMGHGCPSGVSEERALDFVFGYLVINDLTARDKQVRFASDGSSFMVLGGSKNFTGSTRFSNQVVTADEIPDIYDVEIKTFMNGQMTQSNSTRNLINSFGRVISFFSNVLDLTPGTVITTGTPGGTGWGQDKSLGGKGFIPPGCVAAHYLRPGDEVRSVVQGVGEIVFRVD